MIIADSSEDEKINPESLPSYTVPAVSMVPAVDNSQSSYVLEDILIPNDKNGNPNDGDIFDLFDDLDE